MTKSVLIVGAGVFGLSTAVHLAEADTKYHVTVLDPHQVPSKWSASNDYNKIIRCEYTDFIYTKIAVESVKQWRSDPIFKGIYNECGRILITPETHQGRKEFELKSIENLQKIPGEGLKIEYIQGGDELAAKFPVLQYNTVAQTAELKWNPEAGLAHSANAMEAMYKKAKSLGVKFVFGQRGWVSKVDKDSEGKEFVVTHSGDKYTADQIVISAGAATGYIVDLQNQQRATGLFVSHIKVTPQEYQIYKDMPIVFDAEMGYAFLPDPKTRMLKIALPGSGASHMVQDPHGSDKKVSLPRFKVDNPSDTIPQQDVQNCKRFLGKYLPELAYHELLDSKACWIADTADSHLIVDNLPNSTRVFVATGDSGHAFKYLPTIGKYIKAKLEGTLALEFAEPWRWRELEDFDPTACSWRVTSDSLDFADIDWAEESSSKRVWKL